MGGFKDSILEVFSVCYIIKYNVIVYFLLLFFIVKNDDVGRIEYFSFVEYLFFFLLILIFFILKVVN